MDVLGMYKDGQDRQLVLSRHSWERGSVRLTASVPVSLSVTKVPDYIAT